MIKVDYITHCGDDLTTVNAARVSFDKASEWEHETDNNKLYWERLSAKDEKLIHYLAKHKHLSPFGHSFISLRVTAPVFVSRQLVKHKFLRINEVSRRYVDAEPEFFTPDVWRGKPEDKKQGSSDVKIPEPYIHFDTDIISYGDFVAIGKQLYNEMIYKGVAPEQARMLLPQSMLTSWYWSGSLDAFAAMANLRLKPDAQAETRQVAEQVEAIILPLFPHSWSALRGIE